MHQRLPLRPLRPLLIAVEQNTPRVRLPCAKAAPAPASRPMRSLYPLHPKGGGQGRNFRGGAYNHRKWRRRRRYQLMQQPLCELCWTERGIATPATIAHHRVDHHGDRSEFFYGALQSLCREHHERLHGRANDNPWIGEDGLPLPPEQQAERERQHMAKRLWEDNDDDQVG